jgi:hypothetical protein
MTCARSSRCAGVAADAVVLGEGLHHRGDRLAETRADVLAAARGSSTTSCRRATTCARSSYPGVTQDVGHRLRVGKPLARGGP